MRRGNVKDDELYVDGFIVVAKREERSQGMKRKTKGVGMSGI